MVGKKRGRVGAIRSCCFGPELPHTKLRTADKLNQAAAVDAEHPASQATPPNCSTVRTCGIMPGCSHATLCSTDRWLGSTTMRRSSE